MKHLLPVDSWHDNPQLAKWIPLVGPGAALVLLFLIYVILAEVFTYLPG